MLNKFKRGQIGETTTWIVATILIVVILLFFVFGASLLAATKDLKPFKDALLSSSTFGEEDLFLKKSIMTYYAVSSEDIRKRMDFELSKLENAGEFKQDINETKFMVRNDLKEFKK